MNFTLNISKKIKRREGSQSIPKADYSKERQAPTISKFGSSAIIGFPVDR
jgi:hypothetical protein